MTYVKVSHFFVCCFTYTPLTHRLLFFCSTCKLREIAALERRAKALKQDDVSPAKKPNQDYTNFEKSGSTLSANANLSPTDKQDIAELEKRLIELKKP